MSHIAPYTKGWFVLSVWWCMYTTLFGIWGKLWVSCWNNRATNEYASNFRIIWFILFLFKALYKSFMFLWTFTKLTVRAIEVLLYHQLHRSLSSPSSLFIFFSCLLNKDFRIFSFTVLILEGTPNLNNLTS